MYSSEDTSSERDESNRECQSNEPVTTMVVVESHEECSREEGMPWWEWVINRMRDKWSDGTRDLCSSESPFRESEIDDRIEYEYTHDGHKYSESNSLVPIISLVYSIEPE